MYLSSFIHSCNIPVLVMSPYCNILLITEFCKDNVTCVDDHKVQVFLLLNIYPF
jgi:hypothetical protein